MRTILTFWVDKSNPIEEIRLRWSNLTHERAFKHALEFMDLVRRNETFANLQLKNVEILSDTE